MGETLSDLRKRYPIYQGALYKGNTKCIFFGNGAIDCRTEEIEEGKCDHCGWNPEVEQQRKEKLGVL